MQFAKNIIYNILSLQEKFLKFSLSRTIGVKNKSKRKRHFSTGCMLDLNMLADMEKQQLEDEMNNILKTCEFEPAKILEYIRTQGTMVYKLKNADKILNSIGENAGFIYPAKGLKALYLSACLNNGIKFKTNEMFILPAGEINKYYFIYNFYNWYAFKKNIAGMDSDSQDLLKKYLYSGNINELQLEDIYKLKDAIKQDKASIEFVIKLCRNYEGVKQALDKMKTEGSAKL